MDNSLTPQDFGPPEGGNAIQLDCFRRQQLFLEAYQHHGIRATACAETGIPIGTVREWENSDTQQFKRRKELASESALGVVEKEIHRRAIEGVDKPLHHQGRLTGDVIKEHSDNLLMFRAKRLDPEYRDNPKGQQGTAMPHVTVINIHPPANNTETTPLIVEGAAKLVPDEDE